MNNQEYPILLIAALSAAFIGVFLIHVIENKKLKSYLKKKYGSDTKIVRFAWSRSLQLCFSIALFSVIVLLYELQIRKLNDKLHSLTIANDISKFVETNLKITEQIPDTEPVILTQPQPQETIKDIFESDDGQTPEAPINKIKTHYEELLVNYFWLSKCKKINSTDYQIIIESMKRELTAAQAPENLGDEIINAAKGSYEELYVNSECKEPYVESTVEQYESYINSLSEKI